MRYFISIDMEGVWGTSHFREPQERVSLLMTQELADTLDTLLEIDTRASIRVCDSHALGTNILPEKINVNFELVRGFPRMFYMMEGLDESFDAAMFIGYHAPVGHIYGAMDHTYSSSSFFEIKINGKVVGESEINAIYASLYRVPVIFISGDSALFEFSSPHFPLTEFLITKEARGHSAVLLYERDKLYSERVKKIESAIKKLQDGKFKDFVENNPVFSPPYEVEILLKDTLRADLISIMPSVERVDGRRIKYRSEDFRDIYRFIVASSIIAWQAASIK